MSITDELREIAAKTECANGRCEKLYRGDLEHIADRIDAEHEKAIRELNNLASACVLLPKDADGEYIHEHDKVDWRDHQGTWHKNALVVAVCSDGCYVMDDGMVFHVHASDVRHYKQSTVEDVLRDMHAKLDEVTALYVGEAIDSDERDSDEARIFAEYASKLRLTGDAE